MMEQEIRKLIDDYEKMLFEHKNYINSSEKQLHRLEGFEAGLIRAISDLKDILYRSKVECTIKEILAYTE